MQYKKFVAMSSVFLYLCSFFLILGATAADSQQESKVSATFTITFVTGTNLTIDVIMDVQQITTDRIYTKEDIKNIQDPQDLGALRYAVFLLLKDQLTKTFANATLLNFAMPLYQNNQFEEVLNVELSPAFFKLNSAVNTNEFINGVLDMDAVVSYSFDFSATAGWNNTYIIVLPDLLTFRNTTGNVDGKKIQWTLENWNGQNPSKHGYLSLQSTNPTTPKATMENISLEFGLDATRIQKTGLLITINAKSIDIGSYNSIPAGITNLAVVPADGIRLLVRSGYLTWETIYEKTLQKIERSFVSAIESSSFNQTISLAFIWDLATTQNCSTPYTITRMNNTPPISSTWTDNDVRLQIFNLSARAIFGLITAGAQADAAPSDINFGNALITIGYPFSCAIQLPTHVYINGKNPFGWNQTKPFSGAMNSDIAPTYSEEKKHKMVTIELTKMDLNVPSFITGKTELTTPVYTKEDTDIFVTRMPSEFSLPSKIYMDFMNADAFRLCVEEHVFTQDQTTTFLMNQKQQFADRISAILNGQSITGYSDYKVFNSSLQWDRDIEKMDANTPVTISSYAHCLYAVPFNLSFWPPSFNIVDQRFILSGLDGQAVTYRIVFPAGVSVVATDSLDKTIITGETEKNQQYIEISFSAQEALDGDSISCALTASSLYVLGLFFPCILTIVLLVILIIVVFFINKKRKNRGIPRSRRKRQKKEAKEQVDSEENSEPGSEEQEFYVPPPPPSARR